ncbi:MAG: class I SAM-dependent methyltransferase [Chloroflexi bacterium]|nr:class I SAM-dependent methyltransferase [Chloroflexota bacterium]
MKKRQVEEMGTDYDSIATEYQKIKVNAIKKYSEEFTFFEALGDVRGRSVLDLACGDGYYSRALRRAGAGPVVGVDLSRQMIRMARAMEAEAPLGIEYRVGNAATLGAIGAFDLVTAVYLLQYAADEATLRGIITTIFLNLKQGGRFLGVTGYPDLTPLHLEAQAAYGIVIEPQGPLADGVVMRNTFTTADTVVRFENHYWTRPTYERIFRETGFQSIAWHPMQLSPEGRELYPAEYWQAHLQHPAIILLACSK